MDETAVSHQKHTSSRRHLQGLLVRTYGVPTSLVRLRCCESWGGGGIAYWNKKKTPLKVPYVAGQLNPCEDSVTEKS